jgi:RNA polymerase sigma-70 factor, ECF subfamily
MDHFPDISKKTDAELVRLALSNPDFFGHVMERYQDPLARYIRRISNFNTEDVEDALQEIFIKIYKNLNDYDEDLKFSSWIYRIAHNHIIDQFRKRNGKGPNLSLEENDFIQFLKSAADLRKEIEDKDCLERTREIISRLPIKYREILVLRFLEGKSYDEIMDIIRKPKGTVATLINRGKNILKEEMKKVGIDCY